MRTSPLVSVLPLVAALAIGCSEQLAPAEQLPEPVFNFTNGPFNPGIIINIRDDLGIVDFDVGQGLVAVHGLPDDPNDFFLCGGSQGFEFADFHAGFPPAGAIFQLTMEKRFNVHIFDLATFFPHPCAATLLAHGKENLVKMDNDVTGFGGPGANAFGWKGTGFLEDDINGGQLHYVDTQRIVLFQDGSRETRVSSIKLKPVPGR